MKSKKNPIIIFGATGFVGKALTEKLLTHKLPLILVTRNASKIKKRSQQIKVLEADLCDQHSLKKIVRLGTTFYYLVHAMTDHEEFEAIEAKQAQNLAQLLTAKQKVIYLSGLGEEKSQHLSSRHKVGEILRQSPADCFELRASIIIGAGSLSFEMIYAIARRLPFIIKTDWTQAFCEPVALDDIVNALLVLGTSEQYKSGLYEIGCGEVVPYSELIIKVAEIIDRKMISLPLPIMPKKMVLEVLRVSLPEFYSAGKHLLGSIEIPTYVGGDNFLDQIVEKKISLKKALSDAVKNSQANEDFSLKQWQDQIAAIIKTLPMSYKQRIRFFMKFLRSFQK